jgi:hypothetical protein
MHRRGVLPQSSSNISMPGRHNFGSAVTTTEPGSANVCARAAIFVTSPKISPHALTTTGPDSIAMRAASASRRPSAPELCQRGRRGPPMRPEKAVLGKTEPSVLACVSAAHAGSRGRLIAPRMPAKARRAASTVQPARTPEASPLFPASLPFPLTIVRTLPFPARPP